MMTSSWWLDSACATVDFASRAVGPGLGDVPRMGSPGQPSSGRSRGRDEALVTGAESARVVSTNSRVSAHGWPKALWILGLKPRL
jgi:hypothetical protein